MKFTLRSLTIAFALCAASTAFAKGEDLANCRYANGNEIDEQLCTFMRKLEVQDREKAAAEAARQKRADEAEAAYQADQAAKKAERDRVNQAAADKWAEEDRQRRTELAATLERQRKEDAADEARQEAMLKARKAQCGADYAKPRVGMSMDRARQCVGDLHLVSQINRADGVVSTYRAGRLTVHEMGGRIAAWSVY